jgi:serine/threonine protein phosphatase PrpC
MRIDPTRAQLLRLGKASIATDEIEAARNRAFERTFPPRATPAASPQASPAASLPARPRRRGWFRTLIEAMGLLALLVAVRPSLASEPLNVESSAALPSTVIQIEATDGHPEGENHSDLERPASPPLPEAAHPQPEAESSTALPPTVIQIEATNGHPEGENHLELKGPTPSPLPKPAHSQPQGPSVGRPQAATLAPIIPAKQTLPVSKANPGPRPVRTTKSGTSHRRPRIEMSEQEESAFTALVVMCLGLAVVTAILCLIARKLGAMEQHLVDFGKRRNHSRVPITSDTASQTLDEPVEPSTRSPLSCDIDTDPGPDSLPDATRIPMSVFQDQALWRTAFVSRTGLRAENQDCGETRTALRQAGQGFEVFDIAIIADGVGGRRGGRRAAKIAVAWALDSVLSSLDCAATDELKIVGEAMKAASNALQQDAGRLSEVDGMKTTLIVTVVSRQNGQAAVASIGDSEVFIRQRDGRVDRPVEPQRGRQSHVLTACLGPVPVGKPQFARACLKAGDLLVLSTDGVVQPDDGRLSPDEFADAVCHEASLRHGDLTAATEAVIDEYADPQTTDFLGNSIFSDNQTVALIGTGEQPMERCQSGIRSSVPPVEELRC